MTDELSFSERLAELLKTGGVHVVPVARGAEPLSDLIELSLVIRSKHPEWKILFVDDTLDASKATHERFVDAVDEMAIGLGSTPPWFASERSAPTLRQMDVIIWETELPLSPDLTNRFGYIVARVGVPAEAGLLAILTHRVDAPVDDVLAPTPDSPPPAQVEESAPDEQDEPV